MTDEKGRSPEGPTEDELDRQAILARRKRFIGAALLGLAGAAAVACSDAIDTPKGDAGTADAAADATPQPCLSPVVPPEDAGRDTGSDAGADATPQPCLSPLPPDAGRD